MLRYALMIAVNSILTASLCHANEIAVIVNPKNAAAKISAEQLNSIFMGKNKALPEFGSITAINQSEGKAIRDEFLAKITGKSDAQLKAYWAKVVFTGIGEPLKEVASDADVKRLVAANPNMIGYIDKSLVDSNVAVVYTVK